MDGGQPLVPSREYPKAYVDSAGGTYEEYVWVLERLRGPAGNINGNVIFALLNGMDKEFQLRLT